MAKLSRNLAIILLAVALALPLAAQVTTVQTATQLTDSFSGSGFTLTFTSGTTSGNGVVVMAGGSSLGGADPVTGVSDSHSDGCVLEATVSISARSSLDIFYCQTVTAGTTQFTIATSSSQHIDGWMAELHGAGAFDAKGTSTTSFSTYAAPSVTTTAASDFLIGGTAGAEGSGTTLSAGSGWTSLGGDAAAANIAEYMTAGSAGSYSLSLTATGSDYFSSAIVAIKAAAAAATPHAVLKGAVLKSGVLQ